MRVGHAASLVLVVAAALGAAAEPPVTFPPAPVAPAPPPPPVPAPGAVPLLTPDLIYAINSKVDAFVIADPPGLVKVEKETGPITIKGRFIDKPNVVESRKFPGPHVFLVTPAGTGRAYLNVVVAGAKTEADVFKATVDVTDGTAPQPPPGPAPVPVPVPVDDPLLKALQAAYDAEPVTGTKAADKASLAAVLRALAGAVPDPAVKTGDDLFTITSASIEARIGGRLKTKLRPAVGAELNKILPHGAGAGKVPLTDQNRADAAALYLKLADTLDKVK